MCKYRNFGAFCQEEFLEANARLLAKREERKRLKGKCRAIPPIQTAGELAAELLKGIPIVYIKTGAGWMPLADAVDIVDIISATGEPGQRRIKLKIRRKGAGND